MGFKTTGENIGGVVLFESGTAIFNNVKVVRIYLREDYQQPPVIVITPNDNGYLTPFKQNVTTTYFEIRTGNVYTGTFDYMVTPR